MIKDRIVDGFKNAPHRSLYHALGLTKEEQSRPLIGIVCSYNEIVPGHMNLDKIAQAVKLGVAMAGGTPIMFPAITVCDGIAMGHTGMKYSLITRDLIADSTEAMAMAHGFDGLVMIPNCDKNVPGLLMAAARINIPTIFVSGGPMLAGRVGGRKTSLSSMFEAVGAYSAGKIGEDKLCEFEEKACPTCGSCSGMYTANSMNCLTEVLGMGLGGNGTIPAVYSARIELAKHAGMQIMELVEKNICPRDIMTEAAIRNALTADMALGCSTNSMLHLPAIANECGVEFNLDMANEISEKTPNLCHLAPAGNTYMEDLNEAGGVYAVLKELTKLNLLDTSVMTCTCKTLGENIADAENKDDTIIRTPENPYSATGGIAVLRGNLAPDKHLLHIAAGQRGDGIVHAGQLNLQVLYPLVRQALFQLGIHHGPLAQQVIACAHHVLLNGVLRNDAQLLPVFLDHAHAQLFHFFRRRLVHFFPMQRNGAAVVWIRAKNAVKQLGAPGTQHTGNAQHLTVVQFKADVAEFFFPAQIFHL